MNTKTVAPQEITQFELSNLIRKCKLFSKIKLAPSTRLVLESLVFHYPNIRVKAETIADETGCGLKSIENALKELKEKNLIVITYTGRSSIFHLTPFFYSLLEITDQIPKNVRNRSAKIAVPHNKEKKENYKEKSFNKVYEIPNHTKSPERTRAEIKATLIKDDKSPMTDKETAIKYVADLSEMMDNQIIQSQVNKVKQKWDL